MFRMIKEIRKHKIPAYIWWPWLRGDIKAIALAALLFVLFSWGFVPLLLVAVVGRIGITLDMAANWVWDRTFNRFSNTYEAITKTVGLDGLVDKMMAEQRANSNAWRAFTDKTTTGE